MCTYSWRQRRLPISRTTHACSHWIIDLCRRVLVSGTSVFGKIALSRSRGAVFLFGFVFQRAPQTVNRQWNRTDERLSTSGCERDYVCERVLDWQRERPHRDAQMLFLITLLNLKIFNFISLCVRQWVTLNETAEISRIFFFMLFSSFHWFPSCLMSFRNKNSGRIGNVDDFVKETDFLFVFPRKITESSQRDDKKKQKKNRK